MSGPTGDKLIRVDMTDLTANDGAVPRRVAAARRPRLSARILLKECDPTCDPLGPENMLVFAPGVLSGTTAPTSGRISIGARARSRAASRKPTPAASRAGADEARLPRHRGEGPAKDPSKRWPESTADGVKLVPRSIKGCWNYAASEKLCDALSGSRRRYLVRPGRRDGMLGRVVACTDQEQAPSGAPRRARRPRRGDGQQGPQVRRGRPRQARACARPPTRKGFIELGKGYTQGRTRPGRRCSRPAPSTVVPIANMLNTFPYKNRTSGQSPDAATLDGAASSRASRRGAAACTTA